jgi:hypothetical protein
MYEHTFSASCLLFACSGINPTLCQTSINDDTIYLNEPCKNMLDEEYKTDKATCKARQGDTMSLENV